MSDPSTSVKQLRDRLAGSGEERLGKALSDFLDNPLLTGAIGRAFDAREKAAQAQELAMGALNLPSAADIERLTRRLRSVSQRLEGIEDGVHRLDRALAGRGLDRAQLDERLAKIEEQLGTLSRKFSNGAAAGSTADSPSRADAPTPAAGSTPTSPRKAAAGARPNAASSPSRSKAASSPSRSKGPRSKAPRPKG